MPELLAPPPPPFPPVSLHRSNSALQVDFSPKDLAQVAAFLSKENAAKAAPVQQYARALQDRARQRLQLRLADAVDLGDDGGGGGGAGRDCSDGDDDDDSVPAGSLLPQKRKKQPPQLEQQGAEVPAPKRSKQPGGNAAATAALPSDEEEEEGAEGGVVRPYQLSDDDDDEEEGGAGMGRGGGYAGPDFDASDDEGKAGWRVGIKKGHACLPSAILYGQPPA